MVHSVHRLTENSLYCINIRVARFFFLCMWKWWKLSTHSIWNQPKSFREQLSWCAVLSRQLISPDPDISSVKRAASSSVSCLCLDKGARSIRRSCCCVYDWTIALRGTNWLGASISTSIYISLQHNMKTSNLSFLHIMLIIWVHFKYKTYITYCTFNTKYNVQCVQK